MAQLDVLVPAREAGEHEDALFAWLADAVAHDGLALRLLLPAALAGLAHRHGLAPSIAPGPGIERARDALRQLGWGPSERPLLLAPRVLHERAWLTAAAVLARRAVWLYVPLALSAQDMGWRWAVARDRSLAPWLARVRAFVVPDAQQAQTLRRHWRVPAPVFTLPKRLSPPGTPALAPRRHGGRLRVGYVGCFAPHQKGLDWLADTLRHAPGLADGFHWRFQGRGPGEALLQTLASALGPQRVEVVPPAPLDEVLPQIDVLLLPSRYEGLPQVALEATARGWPVVASDRCGLGGLLPPGSVFPFGAPQALRAALQSLSAPSARRAAVAYARQRLLEHLPGEASQRGRRAVVAALRQGQAAA